MCKQTALSVVFGCLSFGSASAFGGQSVAIIDAGSGAGPYWCFFLEGHGHPCTLFPPEGPTGPLDPFDVIIDMSPLWADPGGLLADVLQAGKTVITYGEAPLALGINSNPTVQAWIGANQYSGGDEDLVTTVTDAILGNISPGTTIADCSTSFCTALRDSSGHVGAAVLAVFVHVPFPKPIGIMRNFWGNGVSVYLSNAITPGSDGPDDEIILNSVRIQQLIPTTSAWGLLILVLGVAITGTLILRQRGVSRYQVAGGTL